VLSHFLINFIWQICKTKQNTCIKLYLNDTADLHHFCKNYLMLNVATYGMIVPDHNPVFDIFVDETES